jgi:hypothetical protein
MRFVAMHADHTEKGAPLVMSYQFRVRLDREPTDPEIEALGGACDDAGLSYGNGAGELEFDRDAASFADAVFSAIADVEGATRLHVTAVDADPLVSVLDIAERTGRTREAVRQAISGLRTRRFPPPVNGAGARHRLWRWSEVAAFYGLDDEHTRQAARVADAVNGWLALRRSVPGIAPSADAVAEAVRAA